MDPDFADQNVKEETIRTRIRRKLENGFSGREEGKNGYERTGDDWNLIYNSGEVLAWIHYKNL